MPSSPRLWLKPYGALKRNHIVRKFVAKAIFRDFAYWQGRALGQILYTKMDALFKIDPLTSLSIPHCEFNENRKKKTMQKSGKKGYSASLL